MPPSKKRKLSPRSETDMVEEANDDRPLSREATETGAPEQSTSSRPAESIANGTAGDPEKKQDSNSERQARFKALQARAVMTSS